MNKKSKSNKAFQFGLFASLFIFSGISGLVYQVVWARKLQISFGVTAFAVSAVLSAYFLGLALGSIIGGRYSDKIRRPLFAYGVVEILVGISALLLTPYLDRLDIFLTPLQIQLEGHFWLLQSARFLITVLVLIVPTTLLGTTIPLMSRGIINNLSNMGSRLAILYGLNTFGAAAGVAIAGFFMIETFGLSVTAVVAALISILVGLLAIFIQRTVKDIEHSETPPPEHSVPTKTSGMQTFPLLVVMAISGAVGLSLEVVWTRVLIQHLGTTSYVFSAVLFLFLLGIGLGSYIVTHRIDHWKNLVAVLAFCEAALGLVTIMGATILNRVMPRIIQPLFDLVGVNLNEHFFSAWFLWSSGLLLPTAVFLGATFPLAARIITQHMHVIGSKVGQLYAVNTLGGSLGAIITGFFLIPHVGINATITTLALVSVLLAIVLALSSAKGERMNTLRYAAIPACLVFIMPFILSSDLVRSNIKGKIQGKVLAYQEDYYGTIILAEESNKNETYKRLLVNGVSYSGTGKAAMRYMRLQGHIPMATHPGKPEDVLVICFGVGLTSGSISTYPDTKLTVVELSQAIISLSHWFSDLNENVTQAGNTQIVIDDGRNYLLRNSRKQFDVVTLEPPPPSLAGIGNLYSQDFYRLVHNRLRDNGVAAQWIPLHTQSFADTQMLLASFISIFPNASLWWTETGETLVLGIKGNATMAGGQIQRVFRTPRTRASLAQIGIRDKLDIAAHFLLDSQGLKAFVQQAPIMTDDNPLIEYRPPGINFAYKDILREMIKHRPSALQIAALLGIEQVNAPKIAWRLGIVERIRMKTRLYSNEPY